MDNEHEQFFLICTKRKNKNKKKKKKFISDLFPSQHRLKKNPVFFAFHFIQSIETSFFYAFFFNKKKATHLKR